MMNILFQRPEIVQKKNQLHHKTKKPKDLGSSEWCYWQAFKTDTCWSQQPAHPTPLCGGHSNLLRARQLLLSLTMVSLKPLRECQEALLYTPAIYKDNRSATGIRRSESPTYWALLTHNTREERKTLTICGGLHTICVIQLRLRVL